MWLIQSRFPVWNLTGFQVCEGVMDESGSMKKVGGLADFQNVLLCEITL